VKHQPSTLTRLRPSKNCVDSGCADADGHSGNHGARDFFGPIFWTAVVAFLAFLILGLCSGCSVLSGSRSRTEAIQTTDKLTARQEATIRRASEGLTQPVQLDVRGRENKVDVHLPPTTTIPKEDLEFSTSGRADAGSSFDGLTKSKWTIPIGVSLLLIVAAGFGLLWLVRAARRSSAAANAAYSAADGFLASHIEKLGQDMALSTDNAEIKRHAVSMATAEKERRKLKERILPGGA